MCEHGLTILTPVLVPIFVKPVICSLDEHPKWLMNVLWAMDGMDLNLNTEISKHLADLGQTLTSLTSEEGNMAAYNDPDDFSSMSSSDGEGLHGTENVRELLISLEVAQLPIKIN